VLCGALNRGPFVVDGERASDREEEREGEGKGGREQAPGAVYGGNTEEQAPPYVDANTDAGTIISRRSQRPARGHLCYKRLLAVTNQVTTAPTLFEITSAGGRKSLAFEHV